MQPKTPHDVVKAMAKMKGFYPSDYDVHEALDRTSVLMDMVERTLFDHPGIHKQEWMDKLEQAHQALFDLYQMIGSEHLK